MVERLGMALTINTNLQSLIVQKNLNAATKLLDRAIERMTTGFKINQAGDNAAGYSIATKWNVSIGSLDVALDNASMGADMLSTLEDNYALMTTHLQRIRDLTEQAANGTYGSDSLKSISAEITSRLQEIDRISKNSEFNGIKLMDGTVKNDIALQVGLYGDSFSRISLDKSLFEKSDSGSLFADYGAGDDAIKAIASACSGHDGTKVTGEQQEMLVKIDKVIDKISDRVTTLGTAKNRVESAIESIGVQSENLTSSLSTLRDADVAEESSAYIRAQILQQASATLLSTANQAPSIALNLI